LGWGSSGTPPWVDDKRIDEEKKEYRTLQDLAKIKALEKENEALRKKIRELEKEIEKIKRKAN
jgi:predicted RNase H-like nuclease (RuvC/YqgF family)